MSGMKSGDIHLIGVASGLGASDSGCALGPLFLRAARTDRALARAGVAADWARPLFADPRPSRSAALADLHKRIARRLEATLRRGDFPVVLGGDHSVAVGTWRGVAAAGGEIGLLWIDAHMDSHTPLTTPSGNAHGMPLASLLGDGGALAPEHVALIGIRSYEIEEAKLLESLGVRVFAIEEVQARGFDVVLDEALAIVARARDGFGVSLDVDAIDPRDAPGTGTPVERGLASADVLDGMSRIGAMPNLLAMEIVEYNPLRDSDRQTARLVEALLVRLLQSRHDAQIRANASHVAEAH